METAKPECAKCGMRLKACRSPQGEAPPFCPGVADAALVQRATCEYEKPQIHEFARQASIQEAECYTGRDLRPYVLHPMKPRVQETCEFAHRMGYRRLGLAFCSGLQDEARTAASILEAQGFDVVSVVCKVGGKPKETIGIRDDQKIRIGEFEPMCSPIAQAMILNEHGTEFNIMLGLCVGHDSLFLKHADAPCTVLVVKDRVFGHCPASALYMATSYYPWLKREGF
jgi:uncharacterized metal-binding protein